MSKVSVIIPIYNVEQYLAKCLDSVINQTYTNLEIICVNDCSPDNSIEILKQYAKKDSRIKIVNREKNGGLSAARNSGLDVATGEYVYFIDSDDWIDLDYIEKMVEAATKSASNIVVNINIIKEFQNKNIKNQQLILGNLDIQNPQFIDSKSAINNIIWAACVHLWKRDFLTKNNLKFPEGYIYEDMFFSPFVYSKVNEIYAFNGPTYHYYIRDNSICTSAKCAEIDIAKFLEIFNLEFDYFEKEGYIQNNSFLLYPSNYLIYNGTDEATYDLVLKYFSSILNDLDNVKVKGYLKYCLLKNVKENLKRNKTK